MSWTILRKERQIQAPSARLDNWAATCMVRIVAGLLVCTVGLAQEPSQPSSTSPPVPQPGLPTRPTTEATAMPAEIAELKLPESFTWAGTTRQQGTQSLMATRFRTRLRPELARSVVRAALLETGWKLDESSKLSEGAFINPDRPVPLRFCRNGLWISLSPGGSAANSEVLLAIESRNRSCDAARLPEGVDASLVSILPTLEGPASAASPGRPAAFRPGGGMYGPDTAASWARFLHRDLGEAASHFANQLSGQGWKREAGWKGPSTAGSSWSMQVDDQTFSGKIQLLDVGQGEFFVDFTMVRNRRELAGEQPWKRDARTLTRLIFGASPEHAVQVTHESPRGLGFGIPPQFELIGTALVRPGLTSTAFRTSLPIVDARDALLEVMKSEGWIHEGSADEEALFLISNRTRFEFLCRSADRRIIGVHEIDEVRYLVVSVSESGVPASGECTASGMGATPAGSDRLRSNLPKLTFPESARSVPGENVLDITLNGNSLLHRTLIRSADAPADILQHLAPQLLKTGWERDIEWSGAGSAGSNWRRDADGARIWTTLLVTNLGNELFEVRLLALLD